MTELTQIDRRLAVDEDRFLDQREGDRTDLLVIAGQLREELGQFVVESGVSGLSYLERTGQIVQLQASLCLVKIPDQVVEYDVARGVNAMSIDRKRLGA